MSTGFAGSPVFPARLSALAGRPSHLVTIGQSDASVWRIEDAGETLFLKAAPQHALSELPGEAERLSWLGTTPVPAPRLLDSFTADGQDWLLMTALPGIDLTHLVNQPEVLRNALATGLRALHALDPATCPFGNQLDVKLASGGANVAAGRVDETDFDASREGWTAQQVMDWLLENRPDSEDLVVAHGDASLPNIMALHGAFSGVIDCGRLGVADRWQDLALACRSIIYNCGQEHVAPFLAAYGAAWDEERYRYYCTLDELF
ncbi:APH(3') family aminoglycoside O-phosphotransferase [Devosia sp.]|uniref:APH(3') family aminoglycoside O-phosphotransferase n=1 Tax=Devosia sp. TaxID=1871048 RepID=UPI0019F78202|nr:APH(3') family aminoglycoside O-phosphotransferase [Devosia sp.]MBE0578874.1 aminoglycoside 3'-phosphotransferase [Devosia sp.]